MGSCLKMELGRLGASGYLHPGISTALGSLGKGINKHGMYPRGSTGELERTIDLVAFTS